MDPRTLLRQFNIRPKKSLGQNFLVDEAAAERIVAAADLSPQDAVLEVGPGLGALTQHLAATAGRVVAIELDQRLMPILQHTLGAYANVELLHGDVLELDPATLFSAPYKVVANIPYYITSAILRHLIEASVRPALMVLTVQEEVARRIVAAPGEMSLLALGVQFYGRPRIVARIKAGAFYPRPKVSSAVIQIDLSPGARPTWEGIDDAELFFKLARAGFSQRRKQLHNALAGGLARPGAEIDAALRQAGIDRRRRAETLSVEEWVALTRAFASMTD